MFRRHCIVLSLILLGRTVIAQDYQAEFRQSFQSNDTAKQRQVLQLWTASDPKNPELFTSYFNFYFQKAKKENITLTPTQPNGESLTFQDSTGKKAFIGSQKTYDALILEKGFAKIDEGIRLYPNRLDMRFGKTYVLGQLMEWQRFTDEILGSIHYSATNNNAWTWTNNEKKTDGRKFFLSSLQGYQSTLYDQQDDKLLPYMRTIAEEVLKLYPDDVESLSNLSITYLLTNEYDKAIGFLEKAEKVSPKDPVVLGNIAHAYKSKGNKTNAIKYYEKMVKLEDQEAVAFAKQQLDELRKK